MKSYAILIFLAVFGAVLSIFATIGTFPDLEIPTIVYQMSEEQVNDFSSGLVNTPWNSIVTIGGTVLNVLLTSLGSVVFLAVLLTAIGVPPFIAWAFQGVIYIVYIWDIATWILNRPKS